MAKNADVGPAPEGIDKMQKVVLEDKISPACRSPLATRHFPSAVRSVTEA
jgi:hypothetical protein